jgi:hypothetical protein
MIERQSFSLLLKKNFLVQMKMCTLEWDPKA